MCKQQERITAERRRQVAEFARKQKEKLAEGRTQQMSPSTHSPGAVEQKVPLSLITEVS